MDRQAIKQQLFADIDAQWQEGYAQDFLASLIRLPSYNFGPTYAQELVRAKLTQMGFAIEQFPCAVREIQDLPDFFSHPENLESPKEIYNLAGVREGAEPEGPSFLLFAHIDTAEEALKKGELNASSQDGRLYGLGAADDKGGVAMMLLGAEAVLRRHPHLRHRLSLLSTIGKRGSVGTFTAFQKGYRADAAVYIHPAETGHGFREIKSYSMGLIDIDIHAEGRAGDYRDETDSSEISAAVLGARILLALGEWEQQLRRRHVFPEGQFKGLPAAKVDILAAAASDKVGSDLLSFDATLCVRFGEGETIHDILADCTAFLNTHFKDDPWLSQHPPTLRFGQRKANPAVIPRDHPLVLTVERAIEDVKGRGDFIYQYHGSSDIRLPILYGGTPTIGIGPLCGGLDVADGPEWLDENDLRDGIKIVASLIVDHCL